MGDNLTQNFVLELTLEIHRSKRNLRFVKNAILNKIDRFYEIILITIFKLRAQISTFSSFNYNYFFKFSDFTNLPISA